MEAGKKTGCLSEDTMSIITDNLRELSNLEGNLLSASEGGTVGTFLVTSSIDGEGKTVTALSMAYALGTQTNARVLLIDGDSKSPSLSKLFNLEPCQGLSDILLNKNHDNFTDFNVTEFHNVFLLSCGSFSENSTDIFRSKNFSHYLSDFKEKFDFVIFDGPSFLGSPEVSLIAKHFDGVILVIECESTKWEVVQLVKKKLAQVGAKLCGAVLNKRTYYIPKIFYK